MTSAPFKYHRPATVEEASRLLSRYGGNARLIAGGHSLVPLMKLGLSSPAALIDLSKVDGLAVIRSSGGALTIGAMTTYYELASSSEVRSAAPGAGGGCVAGGRRAGAELRHYWRGPRARRPRRRCPCGCAGA